MNLLANFILFLEYPFTIPPKKRHRYCVKVSVSQYLSQKFNQLFRKHDNFAAVALFQELADEFFHLLCSERVDDFLIVGV